MIRKQTIAIIPILLFMGMLSYSSQAQVYDDHFGTGNDVGVTVTSSSEETNDKNKHTLSGTGYLIDMEEASRFLAQAGFGGTYEEIEYVTQVGINNWLNEQFSMMPSPYLNNFQTTYNEVTNLIHSLHPGTNIEVSRSYVDFVFYDKVYNDADVLRNKAAFALGQIFVLSTKSIKLKGKGYGQSSYHDILYGKAFGNFRDILYDVSIHPIMGFYLSHFQNQKGDPALGTLPDENYAREIMQLFTIGLYELNNDGSHKLDGNGNRIPTYDITDVQELAKVFTGFSGGAWDIEAFPNLAGQPLSFNHPFNRYDLTVPMIMWEQHHDQGTKTLMDGTVIPAGQTGMQDVNDALDALFNHPNVGPFIGYRLIQQLVKSNPSPAYVNRVANAFNNNGEGIRGDMKAVFKAVLTDPEARDCSTIETDIKAGKLKQPIERMVHLCRAFDISSPSGKLWIDDSGELIDKVEQIFMGSPTVFNFFTPFYAEDTYVKPNEMVSPEFQILHSVTSIHYLNWVEDAITDKPFKNQTEVKIGSPKLTNNSADPPSLDFSDEIAALDNDGLTAMIDRLNLILCHGQLSDGTRAIITNAILELDNSNNATFTSEDKVHFAAYLMMVSSDYTILK